MLDYKNTINSKTLIMEEEIIELRNLIYEIIETLNGRDDSVKEWIEERLSNIEDEFNYQN
jgi:hypothetical protein